MDKSRGKLEVAPCFLPTALAGPYWVLDYSEEEGYALISGGEPPEFFCSKKKNQRVCGWNFRKQFINWSTVEINHPKTYPQKLRPFYEVLWTIDFP